MNFERDRVHAAYGLSKPGPSPEVRGTETAGTRSRAHMGLYARTTVKAITRNDAFKIAHFQSYLIMFFHYSRKIWSLHAVDMNSILKLNYHLSFKTGFSRFAMPKLV